MSEVLTKVDKRRMSDLVLQYDPTNQTQNRRTKLVSMLLKIKESEDQIIEESESLILSEHNDEPEKLN